MSIRLWRCVTNEFCDFAVVAEKVEAMRECHHGVAPLVPKWNLSLRTACGLSSPGVTLTLTFAEVRKAESSGWELRRNFRNFSFAKIWNFSKDIFETHAVL